MTTTQDRIIPEAYPAHCEQWVILMLPAMVEHQGCKVFGPMTQEQAETVARNLQRRQTSDVPILIRTYTALPLIRMPEGGAQ